MARVFLASLVIAVVATACSSSTAESSPSPETKAAEPSSNDTQATTVGDFEVPLGSEINFGPAPAVPDGELSAENIAAIELITSTDIDEVAFSTEQIAAIGELGASGDPRVVWILSDILRFTRDAGRANAIADASTELLGEPFMNFDWGSITDHLIAWDIPEPPGYIDAKRAIFTSVLPEWEPFFDPEGEVDWRFVSWGGVRIDDQRFDQTPGTLCNCIPATDNPEVQSADEAWLEDDDVVFGVVVGGEARAYPRQIMEVREMVNDTLGGRDFAMPYCTLCGAAQVWFTDNVFDLDGNPVERPILRTSGLLIRSNKVMYELNTNSVFDTFLGTALTGPLREAGVQLEQHTVVTSTWADWVAEYPETTVLVEDLALGRDFDFRNGRDADGPIFPIGDVDPRLDVHEDVLGLLTSDGTPIAFHVNSALAALEAGDTIEVDGLTILPSGSGIKAVDADGNDVVAHQAFWFAWSQFYEGTALWTLDS